MLTSQAFLFQTKADHYINLITKYFRHFENLKIVCVPVKDAISSAVILLYIDLIKQRRREHYTSRSGKPRHKFRINESFEIRELDFSLQGGTNRD